MIQCSHSDDCSESVHFLCLIQNKIPYKLLDNQTVMFECNCEDKSVNKVFGESISTDPSANLHKPMKFTDDKI